MDIHELVFTFHAFSLDDLFLVPGTTKYGEDTSFCGNYMVLAVRAILNYIEDNTNLINDKYDTISRCGLYRYRFHDPNNTNTIYFLTFVLDTHPWKGEDLESCRDQVRNSKWNPGLQQWWLHHIDLPNKDVIFPEIWEYDMLSDNDINKLISTINFN